PTPSVVPLLRHRRWPGEGLAQMCKKKGGGARPVWEFRAWHPPERTGRSAAVAARRRRRLAAGDHDGVVMRVGAENDGGTLLDDDGVVMGVEAKHDGAAARGVDGVVMGIGAEHDRT